VLCGNKGFLTLDLDDINSDNVRSRKVMGWGSFSITREEGPVKVNLK
jgi:hypothetical protein